VAEHARPFEEFAAPTISLELRVRDEMIVAPVHFARRIGRVVAETDMAMPSSLSSSMRAIGRLAAPDGQDRTKSRPRV
jgi:hypothetical protein